MNTNIESITFTYDLQIESEWLGPYIDEHITSRINKIMIDENHFAKTQKGQLLVEIKSIKPEDKARVTNVQSHNIVSVRVTVDCINPEKGKIFTGRVVEVGILGNSQTMYLILVEEKVQIFITSTDKNLLEKGDVVVVRVKDTRYSKGKLLILGTLVEKLAGK